MAVKDTSWTCKAVAEATGTCPQRATATISAFERRLRLLLRATMACEPDLRPCDLASIVEAVMVTGGALARLDEPQLRRRLTELAEQEQHAAQAG